MIYNKNKREKDSERLIELVKDRAKLHNVSPILQSTLESFGFHISNNIGGNLCPAAQANCLASAAKDNVSHIGNSSEISATTTVVDDPNDAPNASLYYNAVGLAGLPDIPCIFCKSYKTQIEFDLAIHLQECHRIELIKKLSMGNSYHSIEERADYAVELCKKGDQ
jgi:hypothetical protein